MALTRMAALSTDCVNTQSLKDLSLRILARQLNIDLRGDDLFRLIKACQACIALTSGLTPIMLIIRVKL